MFRFCIPIHFSRDLRVGLPTLRNELYSPQSKELTILQLFMEENWMECMNTIVELAKSRHASGIPLSFERVTVRGWGLPTLTEGAGGMGRCSGLPPGVVRKVKMWRGSSFRQMVKNISPDIAQSISCIY